MSEPTSALVPSVDVERPNASEGIATKPVKPESPIRKELEEDESTVEELSAAIDKAEEPGQVSQTAEEEQPKKIDEKATNETTTEDNSSAVDVMENALPSSDAKKEEVTYEIEKVGRHANENAIRDDNESLKNDDGMNSSAKIAENGSVNSNEERISEESVEEKSNSVKDDRGAETDATVEESDTKDEEKKTSLATPVISSSKRSRPSFKYDPNKITLRFLFANKDGLAVTIECNPSDTVGEVKGALISAWPEDVPPCAGGENLRLVCMGKGFLMPDARTLEDIQIPVFKTHPTPINVSIKPTAEVQGDLKDKKISSGYPANYVRNAQNASNVAQANSGCCTIL